MGVWHGAPRSGLHAPAKRLVYGTIIYIIRHYWYLVPHPMSDGPTPVALQFGESTHNILSHPF